MLFDVLLLKFFIHITLQAIYAQPEPVICLYLADIMLSFPTFLHDILAKVSCKSRRLWCLASALRPLPNFNKACVSFFVGCLIFMIACLVRCSRVAIISREDVILIQPTFCPQLETLQGKQLHLR